MKSVKILDCTLRDGGYYNNWEFPEDLINAYIKSMNSAKIDILEIGFRSLINDSFKGPLAFSKDEFLDTLVIPKNITIAVMINSFEINEGNLNKKLGKLFPLDKCKSRVDMVRIACNYKHIESACNACEFLSNKGYDVAINLMQFTEITSNKLVSIAERINRTNVKVLYLADSLGCANQDDIKNAIEIIKTSCKKEIGIHAHDNRNLALVNSISAALEGCSWVDSTILGMGRGSGNCKTEELLIELNRLKNKPFLIIPILNIINDYFLKLKNKYNWGTNFFYYLSGKYKIHPSYIQEIINERKYSNEDKIQIIEKLRNESTKTQKILDINQALNHYEFIQKEGTWNAKDSFQGKDILIVGNGPTSSTHKSQIEKFIIKFKPLVIGLNATSNIASKYFDYKAACHPIRFLAESHLYNSLNCKLICPKSVLRSSEILIDDKKICHYGIKIDQSELLFDLNFCKIPSPLVLIYTIAACISGNSKTIYLVGIDGENHTNNPNEIIDNFFYQLKSTIDNLNIISLTPTNYKNIKVKSIYGY
ncbi:aldolase catalytic domain-containing protein [Prochlorococcus sp. AH-716-M06]|nr:aldolase catalytic domain-containing protein [Prochlorococcus sp. AH-716-M06]